ncbi:P-loop containing nucleoside triphosphate hydrolase protein [Pyronema omphalodes]|nr:P-loop containing nucleoside triphosphate hydrolase protein [Pyronema omphalodes]
MPPKSFKPTRDRKQRNRPKPEEPSDPNSLEATVDPNADIIVPLTTAEKKEKRRQQLLAEARAEKPMTGKKLKRFNKYIETKLKKEEKDALLEKFAENQVDTSLFMSTKAIGASRESKKQKIKRALLEEQAGINIEQNRELLYEERRPVDIEEFEEVLDEQMKNAAPPPPPKKAKKEKESEVQEDKMEVEEEKEEEEKLHPINFALSATTAQPFSIGVAVGSGLKRPLDGADGGPPIIKRIKKDRKPRIQRQMIVINKPTDSDEEMPTESEEEEDSEDDEGSDEGSDEESEGEEEEFQGFSDDNEDEEGSDEESDDEDGSGSEEDDSDDDDEEDESEEEEEEVVGRLKKGTSAKANAFKEWASAQRKTVDGDTSVAKSNLETAIELKSTIDYVPQRREEDMTPPPEELRVAHTDRKVHYVTIPRTEEIQTARLQLPVVAEEQRIMEAIHSNSVIVICGETGSGKTTQVPQFLYEAGYGSPDSPTPGMIGVTQPRRVAAVSMADRVGKELGPGGPEKVAYQIRFDGTVGPNTAIKFMTDGVLLRELADDFLLRKYSAIIVDEAHERSINTDILIGVMSRVVKLRLDLAKKDGEIKPLKLIIMSATLRVSDFVENKTLFKIPPPMLKVDARQHPVTIHFSRRTASDYVEEAFKKVCRINRRLPPGGVLVFLTGQQEILTLMKKLKAQFPLKTKQPMGEVDVEYPLHVLPLYSLLPTKEQLKVFEEVPEGARLCVLATNVAETSLTIPGIRYVVDCGRSKERNYDRVTGVQSFDIQWTSKASAMQRAGRAGRTGPGHCYRLYSSAVYETEFAKFAQPELLRMPIEGVVLQMKAMNIDTITNFPFPTPPDRESLNKAEKLLGYLRAIAPDGTLTQLGRTMNFFPLSPRFAKILMIGQQHKCLPYVIAIVSALSVGDIFVPEQQLGFNEEVDEDAPSWERNAENSAKSKLRSEYYKAHANFSSLDPESDALKLLSVVCAYEYEKHPAEFCHRSFIRLKAMEETRKLRQQITKIVIANCPGVLQKFEAKLPPPSKLQVKALKQIVAAGFIDNVAIRADLLPNSDFKINGIKNSTAIPYITLFPSSSTPSGDIADQAAYLHQSSVLAAANAKPEYVIYSELTKASSGSGKVWMKPLTTISGGQLAALAEGTPLITYSKPLESKPPRILPDSNGNKREVWVVPRIGAALGKSGLGWSMLPMKIVQKREGLSQNWVKE